MIILFITLEKMLVQFRDFTFTSLLTVAFSLDLESLFAVCL